MTGRKASKSTRKAVAAAAGIAAPTRERMARGGIACVTETLPGGEIRRGFRVALPIDAYAKRGWITDRQADAGRRFADIAAVASLDLGAYRLLCVSSRVCAAFASDRMSVARLSALGRLAKIRSLVGRSGFEVLYLVCHLGEEAHRWSGAMGRDAKARSVAAMAVLRRALEDIVQNKS